MVLDYTKPRLPLWLARLRHGFGRFGYLRRARFWFAPPDLSAPLAPLSAWGAGRVITRASGEERDEI